MAKTAYIAIGSNLGDKLSNCLQAVGLIDRIAGCRVTARSDFFRTAPVGVTGHDWYVNGVIEISAEISAHQLLRVLLSIENDMGRVRVKKWDPRTIDLDILLFGKETMEEESLIIPHPLMHLRRFVLAPIAQIAPDLIHPVLNKTMKQLLEGLGEDDQSVIRINEGQKEK
ncbi:2-amino-4-hydroxy-6-hydroxymethyldihydropteridinepyrophosphokinase [uncultured Desulfobacterium sp.]|uniref:2-amino-4-hydroxy-6-hydroxymethyldihydropteridine pyrophosphokinase n=1 Tax=uncultured Desulfobacterium sp. TaxID=201089 RepID=A0A445MVS0_9BACT|nr:2-amino-4-hydroxy-6-hydroxymethyldihydropteridinepyrophosphokinase [uncultured Desulfobacterium sp.]